MQSLSTPRGRRAARRSPRHDRSDSWSQRDLAVLVVDDHPEQRERLTQMLSAVCGDEIIVRHAADGHTALDMLRRERLDVVLIDYMLPDMDGLELVSEIAGLVDDTAVILMTSQGNERIAARSIKNGARDYLVKRDLTPEALQAALVEALRTARMEWRSSQKVQRLRESHEQLTDSIRDISQHLHSDLTSLESSFSQLKSNVEQSPLKELVEHCNQVESRLRQSKHFLDELVEAAEKQRAART